MTIAFADDQWEKIYAVLSQDPRAYAGNAADCRCFLEGVLWLARSGGQWRLLPEKYGKWNSVYKRFARWQAHGVFERLFAHFSSEADMENLLIDSTVVRAHPCSAGALKKRWTVCPGARAFSGRLHHQGSYRCGRIGQPATLHPNRWASA